MIVVASAVASYLLLGFSKVRHGLRASPIDRAPWARNPSILVMVLLTFLWPYPMLVNAPNGRTPRGVAFWLLAVVFEWGIAFALIWLCAKGAISITSNPYLLVGAFIVLFVLGNLIVMPIVSLLLIPVMLVLSWPLDLLFPLPKDNIEQIVLRARQARSGDEP